MRCGEAKRLMQMALARDATAADQERLDEHISECPKCAAQWAMMSNCAETLQAAIPPTLVIERDLASKVLERVGTSRTGDMSHARRVRKLAVAATTALFIVVVFLGVLLPIRRPPNLFAAVLEAMAEVKTAHIVTTKGDTDFEVWFSREHGVRSESANYIEILTWEAGWVYDRRAHKVTVRGALPDAVNECFMSLSGTYWLTRDDGRRVQVSDVVLRGAPAKRIDIELSMRQHSPPSSTAWIDPATMRVMIIEMRDSDHEGRIVVDRFRIDYDMPVDPALFTFEPPEGATVVDTRTDSKHTETADNIPIEKNADFAQKLIDAVYAGSLRAMADSLDEPLHRSLPDWVLGGTAAVLRQQFGMVKDLEFQSIKPVQQFWVEVVWAVIAEHGSYEMKLTFDAEGEVTGVWFRFPSDVKWATAMELGVDYVKQPKQETSAQNGD